MDQNQPTLEVNNTIPTPTVPTNSTPNTDKPKKVGPIIVTLVIILILIIGILYIFASRITQPSVPTDNNSIANQPTTVEAIQPVTGTADDPSSLQNDLNSSTNGLDSQNF